MSGVNDRDEFAQGSASQPVSTHGQPTSFRVGQPQSPMNLSPENAILFAQIGDRLLLPAVQPTGHDREKQPRGREIDHGGSLHQRRISNLQVVRPSSGTLRDRALSSHFLRSAGQLTTSVSGSDAAWAFSVTARIRWPSAETP